MPKDFIKFQIREEHPRVYVNQEIIHLLRGRTEKTAYAQAVQVMQESIHSTALMKDYISMIEANAFYFLISGEEVYGKKAIVLLDEYIKSEKYASGKTELLLIKGQMLHTLAMVYDWCYTLIDASLREVFLSSVADTVEQIEAMYPKKDLRDIMINISETQLVRDLMAVAVAVYDEMPELFERLNKKFLQEYIVMMNFKAVSEGYPQGPGFGALRAAFDMHLIWLFDRMGYGFVFSEHIGLQPYYLIYMRRPDGLMFHDGDTYIDYDKNGNPCRFSRIFMHAASYYRDPVLHGQFLEELDGVDFHGEFWNNNRIDPVEFMLFYDDTVKVDGIGHLPKTKLFPQPIGAMVCRTGWQQGATVNDVAAYFKIGVFNFDYHQHLDCGQYQVYYKGYLAVDSGGFAKYGDGHDVNYNKRTVAHNCMLFHKPREKMIYRGRDVSNDGGQVYFNDHHTSFSIIDMFEGGQKTGKFINEAQIPNCITPKYSHLRGMYDDAYGTKLNTYSRSFLFINTGDEKCPVIICIIDRMKSRFKKSYLLHTMEKPQVLFNNVIVKDSEKGGRMVHTTVFPATGELSTKLIGGNGSSFYVDSANYEPALTEKQKKIQEPGGYRVEITSNADKITEIFMNVMQFTSGDDEFMYEVIPSEEEQGALCVSDYKIYYLNEICYEYQVKTAREGLTHFVILNARLGYYSVRSKDTSVYIQCECRDNIMTFTLPKGEYYVERIIM